MSVSEPLETLNLSGEDCELSKDDCDHCNTPHHQESSQTASPAHLVWDSTFEALKTLESSMKLKVEAYEDGQDSPHESDDSQWSAGPEDRSRLSSSLSLAWDNYYTGELLAGADHTSPQSLNSSMQSLDIDEIIHSVAPTLLQYETEPLLSPKSPRPKYNTLFTAHSAAQNSVFVTSSPFPQKLFPGKDSKVVMGSLSPLSCENSESGNVSELVHTSASQHCVSHLFPFLSYPNNSPTTDVFIFPPSGNKLPHKPDSPDDLAFLPPSNQNSLSSPQCVFPQSLSPRAPKCSLLTVPSSPGSPHSCATGDYFSVCGSLDSYLDHYDDALNYTGDISGGTKSCSQEVFSELRQLEEKLFMWKEVRMNTIMQLRSIADYMDSVGYQASMAQVVGAGGGVLASGLTIMGGVLTVFTAGAAVPVLVAGAGLGLASGLAGGTAAITKKILSSKQMVQVDVAIEVDSAATSELASEMDNAKNIVKVAKAAGVVFSVGGVASSTKGLLDIVRGVDPGQTILASIETMGSLLGENVNKEMGKMLVQASSSVLAGTVTSMFGGVTMLWDMYQLRAGITRLAEGGEEGAKQIRDIAYQLEEGLKQFFLKNQNDLDWFNLNE
eukprot:GFUD01036941.1.p1 GENE.GFUD01036941.1~~GFUD01036941.1.p1  ORF type:complete len:610 (+),score=186.62 GFUD01036941.1:76-1905(+)